MLKLPKGLKKKKKGKKSKKDQELFTEEELEQYKREHQVHSEQPQAEDQHQEKPSNDDEWSKFAALTTGVDSILKKTQGDLDRIKSTSFFKRVPPPSETKVEEKPQVHPVEVVEEEPKSEEKDPAKKLLNAVVELSDSDDDSDFDDSAFDTTYIDKELPLAYVPESPEEETDLGPDPFDTGYAEKVIKGPEVSSRGKKLVNIGVAVEVLTGKVENTSTSSKSRRQRRGIQNLLLESFETNPEEGEVSLSSEPVLVKTLLDEPAELADDIPFDFNVSLHLNLLQQQQKHQEEENSEIKDEHNVLEEFDVLKKNDDDDEFAQLAADYSLTKKEEVTLIGSERIRAITPEPPASTDWAEFEIQKGKELSFDKMIYFLIQIFLDTSGEKPKRPPPPTRPPQPSNLQILLGEEESEEENLDDDPFDTAYVEKIVPKSIEYDDDFDPRAAGEDENLQDINLFDTTSSDNKALHAAGSSLSVLRKDLLSTSHTDLVNIVPTLEPSADNESDPEIDPFDTSAVNALVAPGKTELKYLEQELLENNQTVSLSDDDFDPRAGEEAKQDFDSLRQRKSSLSLQITPATPKLVSFAVATPDLLKVDAENGGKIPKPLTPYYNRQPSLTFKEETIEEDPFDTSFVPNIAPSTTELDLIEKEILKNPSLRHSLSDPDFDPRAVTPVTERVQTDLFLAPENHDIKVLTPAKSSSSPEQIDIDPFDTSIAINILPGTAELKLLEDELIEKKPDAPLPSDILSDTQDNSIYVKILTPQPKGSLDLETEDDFDPFDTSFASNLAPGETEIKLIENELIN